MNNSTTTSSTRKLARFSRSSRRPSKKWTQARIEELDPVEDYAEIWRLMGTYRLNDFAINLVFAHMLPKFTLSRRVAPAIWRDGSGKAVQKSTQRVEDTFRNNMIWWHYGPEHEKTKNSVEKINRVHAYYAERYPEAFNDPDDYVYVMCMSAIVLHRLRTLGGLPGFTDKEKFVAHRFWKNIGQLFTDSSGTPLMTVPDDWDGMVAFVEEYDARHTEFVYSMHMEMLATTAQFATRWFPKPLHKVGYALVASTYGEAELRVGGYPAPHPLTRKIMLRVLGLMLWASGLGPDPEENYQMKMEKMTREERLERARKIKALDQNFRSWFLAEHNLEVDIEIKDPLLTTTSFVK